MIDICKFRPMNFNDFPGEDRLIFEKDVFVKILQSFNEIILSYQRKNNTIKILTPFENM